MTRQNSMFGSSEQTLLGVSFEAVENVCWQAKSQGTLERIISWDQDVSLNLQLARKESQSPLRPSNLDVDESFIKRFIS